MAVVTFVRWYTTDNDLRCVPRKNIYIDLVTLVIEPTDVMPSIFFAQ